MRNYRAKNVDEFIAGTPEEARDKLREIRAVVKSAVPGAEEKISWGVPFYWYQGALAGFAPVTHYILFGLVTVLSSKDRKVFEKKGYKTGKKTVQIKFDQKVPVTEIKQILKGQVKMNEVKKAVKRRQT